MIVAILGITQLVLCIHIVLTCFKQKSFSIFMWGTIMLTFALPHAISSLLGTDNITLTNFMSIHMVFSENVLLEASVFAIIFMLIYILFGVLWQRMFPKQKIYITSATSNDDDLFVKIIFFIYTAIFLYTTIAIYQDTDSLYNVSWGQILNYQRENNNYFDNILGIIANIGSGTILYMAIRKKNGWVLTILAIFILQIIFTNSRGALLPIISNLYFYLYIYKEKIFNARSIVYSLFSLIIIIYFVNLMGGLRDYTLLERFDLAVLEQGHSNAVQRIITGAGEFSLRSHFYYYIMNDNDFYGFGEGRTYLRMLLFFLPQRLFADLKPEDFNITQGSIFMDNLNMHATFFGDCYANFGFIAVLLAIFWSAFANIVDYISSDRAMVKRTLLFAPFAHAYMAIGRGYIYGGYLEMILTYLVISMLYYLYNNAKLIRIRRYYH